jgi:hypothetical protein
MLINARSARAEWANRVTRQSEEMLIIARATNDDEMRDELLGCARRLDEHAARIKAAV